MQYIYFFLSVLDGLHFYLMICDCSNDSGVKSKIKNYAPMIEINTQSGEPIWALTLKVPNKKTRIIFEMPKVTTAIV